MRWSGPASAKQRADKRSAPLSRNFDFIRRIPVKTAGDEPVERPEAFQELRAKEERRLALQRGCVVPEKLRQKRVDIGLANPQGCPLAPEKHKHKKRHIKHTNNQ